MADLLRTVSALKEDQTISELNSYETELWISRSGQTVRVALDDVSWFEAAGDYVQVHLEEETLLLYDSLRSLAERLDPDRFMRVHRSAIVALQKVQTFERGRYGGLKIEVESGQIVSCSRSQSAAFRAAMGQA